MFSIRRGEIVNPCIAEMKFPFTAAAPGVTVFGRNRVEDILRESKDGGDDPARVYAWLLLEPDY